MLPFNPVRGSSEAALSVIGNSEKLNNRKYEIQVSVKLVDLSATVKHLFKL